MKKIYYNLKSCEELIAKANEESYELIQTSQGGVGLGIWYLIPPDDKHYYFKIQEEYKNEWSSTHWIMKSRKMPKSWQEQIDEWEKNKDEL